MKTQPSSHHLDVGDGRLYYEVRGSGPLLLVIGQPMTSGPFGPLADLLAEYHTVVTYDPHGLGASTTTNRTQDITPEVEAMDLAHLVDAVGGGKADVFGTSGGAVAGLALAADNPDKVGTLIAHEPPLPELLPDVPHVRAAVDDIEDAYHEVGRGAAFGKFVSLVMHRGPVTKAGVPPAAWPPAGSPSDDPESQSGDDVGGVEVVPERSEKQQSDDELFLLRMLKPFLRYEPKIDVLRSGGPRVVVAVGAASGGEIPQRSSELLAQRLGATVTIFPGDHAGFLGDPGGFAATIRQVLAESH
ncbi:MAG TPA: alpha/beta hydrolase [Propionibacteriaceae bacterium]|jgi:pimeloyl-ACP methyl ester carboxylesterase|nr:alpha/beta hydrolase [Propionibacteriaceae bacterium]